MTLARIWLTKVLEERAQEYERFARDTSLPMFQKQQGFRGVIMLRSGGNGAVITFWDNEESIEALAASPSYAQTVEDIGNQGFLLGESSVEIFDAHLMDVAALIESRS